MLYPFVTAAVAINLFMLSLMCQTIGLVALTPASAVLFSLPIGLPTTWLASRWIRNLIAEAEHGE